MSQDPPTPPPQATYTTIEAARLMGLAVRSVQLMVDRGELKAWKTAGGHRRIERSSVHAWLDARHNGPAAAERAPEPQADAGPPGRSGKPAPRVLLIEDSVHYQNLVKLLLRQRFPQVELHVASDGILGLAMAGSLAPQVLLVDILLPGIDGAALITGLRSHAQFESTKLLVLTSLDDTQRAPYAFALEGIPVIHKPDLVKDLPRLLAVALDEDAAGAAARGP